ncbi:MAG: BatD family protein [Mariprofundaceae bacterium]|nr:BatD family protein [Mariprofundaceae bacterium]
MINKVQCLIACLCLCLYPQFAMADRVTASLDRSITAWGESVQLTIHVDGSADKDPDLSVLNQHFEVLSQSQSSNYTLVNGSLKKSKAWIINLMPKQTGALTIPAISLGNVTTTPLSLNVLAQQNQVSQRQHKDIFLEVSAMPHDSYVQAQIILVVKLFRAINLSQAELTEPDMPNALIKKIGKDKNYKTVRGQRQFVVTERHYGIFPQQSGLLHIPALQFTGQEANRLGVFNQRGRVFRVQSQALDINIAGMPSTWPQSRPWLPAQDVSIREIFPDGDAPALKVGEPLTRTIEIRAKGLTAEQLPQVFTPIKNTAFKQYPDKPELRTEIGADGIVGIRREKIALIPMQAGDFSLPGMAISWWNTTTHMQQKAEILDRMVKVQQAFQQVNGDSLVQEKKHIGKPLEKKINRHDDMIYQSDVRLWQALTALFATACLLMVMFLWYSGSRHKKPTAAQIQQRQQKQRSLRKLRKQLEIACKAGHAKEVAKLLPEWGTRFFEDAAMTNFTQLKGKSDAFDDALIALEKSLYGKVDSQQLDHKINSEKVWQGDALFRALSSLSVVHHEDESLEVTLKALS